MNRKELSAVVAECAARTERAAARTETARADIEVSRAGIEAARKRQEEAVARAEAVRARQEEAVARQEEAIRRQEKGIEEFRAARKKTEEMFQGFMRRAEEDREWAKRIFAELNDQRDERRALMEALLQLMDRLPPPPPHLRSA